MTTFAEKMEAPPQNGAPQRTYTEEVITPEIAEEYLKRNKHNRKLKDHKINAYAKAIINGQWRCNGESIKFSKSGFLIDGQNRLHAIVKCGIPVLILVVRGLEDRDQESMDIGAQRTLADILTLRGEKCINSLAATIRALYIWDHTGDVLKRTVGGTGQSGKNLDLTLPSLIRYFDNNAVDCRYIAGRADQFRVPLRVPASILSPLIREMERIDQGDAEDFLHRLSNFMPSPKNLGEQDPIVQLNKAMRRLMDNTKSRYIPTELAALIIKGWNAYREGAPVAQLRWRSGGNAPEPFPAMK